MQVKAITNINSIWGGLAVGQQYTTPDNSKGADLTIAHLDSNSITILTEGKPDKGVLGSRVEITHASFIAALEYLYTHRHSANNPCVIASNNTMRSAGPLCVASRTPNRGTRCINYILPILKHFNLVGINGSRPNLTWYI